MPSETLDSNAVLHERIRSVLDADSVTLDDIMSAAGAKCDCHNVSACTAALECVPD